MSHLTATGEGAKFGRRKPQGERRDVKRLILAAVCLSLVLPVPAANPMPRVDILYADTGFDPDDVPDDQGAESSQRDPDVRSTTRKASARPTGGRSLSIVVRTFERFYGYWTIVVRLDSRGGPHADVRMRLSDDGAGTASCRVRSLSSGVSREGTLRLASSGDRAVCRTPLRWLRPNKRIGWKLLSRAARSGVDEYAPDDHTWYV
jgi:hypothetical protein